MVLRRMKREEQGRLYLIEERMMILKKLLFRGRERERERERTLVSNRKENDDVEEVTL
jgi:hypothetical protein